MTYEPGFRRLRLYNLFMGFLHLTQGVVIIIISNSFSLPVTTSFLTFDSGLGKLWPSLGTLAELPLGIIVAVFLPLSAVAHFIVAKSALAWQVFAGTLRPV